VHAYNLSIHFWFWLLQIYFQGALIIILLSSWNLASGVFCVYKLVDLLWILGPSYPHWCTFNAVPVRGRCCVRGVIMRYKCTYSFFSSFLVSISSYVLYKSRKCKKCQTKLAFVLCGCEISWIVPSSREERRNWGCLRNRVLRKICAHTRVVTEDGEDYISRSAIICTRNILFGKNSGD